MPIKSDKWIRRMCEEHRMIEPFEAGQVRDGVVSYGLSSYGYDIRVSKEFKVFTNVHNTIVDPKRFDAKSFVDFNVDECIIPPNSFALARTEEYFRIPRDVLVVCVGKSTYARCFSGDTRVALVDGSAPTLEEMAERHERGEMFWGYALGEHGRIEVALLDAPRFIDRDALLEITLDNDRTVRATPEHEFILRDGRRAQAGQLRSGDSLMPLYRELVRGYEAVYQPLSGHLLPTHRLADEWNVRNAIYEDVPGTHRHHSEAIKEGLARLSQDPEWCENYTRVQSERAVAFWSEERYEKARAQLRRHRLVLWQDEERRAAARDRLVARYSNPEERRIQGELPEWTPSHRAPRVRPEPFRGRRTSVDERNHKVKAVRELPGQHDVYCLSVPEAGNFALDAGVFVRNCGLIVNVTPLEPTWEGYLTLEISNTTPLPAKVYGGEGIAQLLFFEGDEEPEVAYADRQGKYMKQVGVTLPKL